MLVKDIMSKGLKTIMPETSIGEAMVLMQLYQCNVYPVAVDGELVGYVQLQDLLKMLCPEKHKHQKDIDIHRLQREYAPLNRTAVKQVMDNTIKSVSPAMPVNEAMEVMCQEHISRLAVTENSKLVGMISRDDVNVAIFTLTSGKVAA